tara:strand:+ start:167 stop:604 length:438 start_codon:yes stop_codon:yes gene_type:complete
MKILFKKPVLLLALMFAVSCGKDSKKEEKVNENKEALCTLVKERNKLINDVIEAAKLADNNPIYFFEDMNGKEEINRIMQEFLRIEKESDKYTEARDGRTEEDIKANIKTLMSCPDFNQEIFESEEFPSAFESLCDYYDRPCPGL